MDKLPPELIERIISHVHKPDLQTCRLVCKVFEAFAFPLLFDQLPQWLHAEMKLYKHAPTAGDTCGKTVAEQWPKCPAPSKIACSNAFLRIVYRRVCMKPVPAKITPQTLSREKGLEDLSIELLHMAECRYLAHLVYGGNKDDSGYLMGGMF